MRGEAPEDPGADCHASGMSRRAREPTGSAPPPPRPAAAGETLQNFADTLFAWFGAESMLKQVTLIVFGFIINMSVRAIALPMRNRCIARLHARYVEHRRLKVLEAVAGADWQTVAGVQHAHVTNALTLEVAALPERRRLRCRSPFCC